jgi:hypothetical protein
MDGILKEIIHYLKCKKKQKISMQKKFKRIMVGGESQYNVLNVTQIKVFNLLKMKKKLKTTKKYRQRINFQ